MLIYNKSPVGVGVGLLGSGCGGITMTCPVCNNGFRRPPSHAKRVGVNTCSRACAAEIRKIRIVCECVICKKSMEVTPANSGKITTCSKLCSSIRRRSGDPDKVNIRAHVAYKNAIEKIIARGTCEKCGINHGPWAVRGLKVSFTEKGEAVAHQQTGVLWCRACHLQSIALSGGIANGNRIAKNKVTFNKNP